MSEILPAAELAELAACEQVIQRGLKTFIEVGSALVTIRDKRLYRGAFATFGDYCAARWNLGRAHAYRMIQAAEVVSPIGDTGLPLPANEAQARALAPLSSEPELITQAWRQAVTASGGKPTARLVEGIVGAIRHAARVEAHGGRGGDTAICSGCAICHEDSGIVCHYAPRRRPSGLLRVVYVDGHGIAYDRYENPEIAADASETHAGARFRQLCLPDGEQYLEIRQPPRSCGISNCPACAMLGDSIARLFSGALTLLQLDAAAEAAYAEVALIGQEWQRLLDQLAYIARNQLYKAEGFTSMRDWVASTGNLPKLRDIIAEGPDVAGITVPPGLAAELESAA